MIIIKREAFRWKCNDVPCLYANNATIDLGVRFGEYV